MRVYPYANDLTFGKGGAVMFGTFRTVLALMVVAMHIGGFPSIGSYAVFGFFILSGYLMTLVMQRSYGYSRAGFNRYALNRFLRIYPIYWVSIAVTLGLIAAFGQSEVASFHPAMQLPDPLEWVGNLALVIPQSMEARLTPPAWALTIELFYYVLIGLGLSRTTRRCLMWLGASVAWHSIEVIPAFSGLSGSFADDLFGAALPFATGAIIYHFKDSYLIAVRQSSPAWSPPFLLALIVLNCWIGVSMELNATASFYVNYLLCAVTVVVLLDHPLAPSMSARWDTAIGDLSYPIYLLHYQVAFLVMIGANSFGADLSRPEPLLCALAVPAILVVSWGVARMIEKPIDDVRDRLRPVRA